MKTIATLALCVIACQPVLAQTSKSAYFEGPSISLGIASNKSTTTKLAVDNKGSSSVGVAKFNYGFATPTAFKLGLSVSADLGNSELSNGISMKRKTPTEVTLDPGVLLTPVTLAYAKLGSYSGNYATRFGSQSVSGTSVGLGLKSYLTHSTFIQGELTQHKANGSETLGWEKFRQLSSSVMVGYSY